MLFPILGPSSLPVVVAQPDERHAKRAYSATSSSNEEEEFQVASNFGFANANTNRSKMTNLRWCVYNILYISLPSCFFPRGRYWLRKLKFFLKVRHRNQFTNMYIRHLEQQP